MQNRNSAMDRHEMTFKGAPKAKDKDVKGRSLPFEPADAPFQVHCFIA